MAEGDQILYEIRVKNTGNVDLTGVRILDNLDEFLDANLTGLDCGNLPVGGADCVKYLTATVKSGLPCGRTIKNSAVATSNEGAGDSSGEVSHKSESCGSGGGNGSAPTITTAGRCVLSGNGVSWQCLKVQIPDDDPEYELCVESGQTEDECKLEFLEREGFVSCDANGSTEDVRKQCESIALDVGPDCGSVCPSCFQSSQGILKKIIDSQGSRVDKTTVANDGTVEYEISLNLKVSNSNYQISSPTEVRFYDFVVPADSGSVWGRHGLSSDWKWKSGGRYFVRNLSSGEISQLNSSGEVSLKLRYKMRADLIPTEDISSSPDHIKNVAFAVVRYKYTNLSDGSTGETFDLVGDDSGSCDFPTIEGVSSGSTLGDTAEVRIARPFVAVKSGGNLGVDAPGGKLFGTTENSGNSSVSGKIFVRDGASLYSGSEKVDFENLTDSANVDSIKSLATRSANVGGMSGFKTTPADSGIYFHDGDLTISGNLDLDRSSTFVIDGDLTISGDLTILGENFAAFIVRNGDLKIDKNVQKMHGVFIVEGGKIVSDGGESAVQLAISGGMMGDAENLLQNRKFIGVDPENLLEPSIKIRYDLRLAEATPPSLESFLGEGWRQE